MPAYRRGRPGLRMGADGNGMIPGRRKTAVKMLMTEQRAVLEPDDLAEESSQ